LKTSKRSLGLLDQRFGGIEIILHGSEKCCDALGNHVGLIGLNLSLSSLCIDDFFLSADNCSLFVGLTLELFDLD
jgi:hypothetical protein